MTRLLAALAVLAILAPATSKGIAQAAYDAINQPQMEK